MLAARALGPRQVLNLGTWTPACGRALTQSRAQGVLPEQVSALAIALQESTVSTSLSTRALSGWRALTLETVLMGLSTLSKAVLKMRIQVPVPVDERPV